MVSRLLGLRWVNVCVLSALFCSGVFDLVFCTLICVLCFVCLAGGDVVRLVFVSCCRIG